MRNSAIDAFRCLLIFGICFLHSITQGGHNISWAANVLQWCVPGFMFISGWFGIKFSVAKVLKLYGISLYCATVFVIFDVVANPSYEGGGLLRVYKIAIGQWFLNAYTVVMCLAPLANLAIERMLIKDLIPISLCAFGWSFATTLPVICNYMPNAAGLQAYSFLTLFVVYVVARFIRRMVDVSDRFRNLVSDKRYLLSVATVSLMLCSVGLGDYNSPFAILVAGCVFFLIKKIKFSPCIIRICVWLGPSMFSVYLMHSHGYAWKYLVKTEDYILSMGLPLCLTYIITAIIVFSVCVVADMPRRLIGNICAIKA